MRCVATMGWMLLILLVGISAPAEAKEEEEAHLTRNYINRIKQYIAVNSWSEAKRIIDEGLSFYPDDPDLRYYNGRYFYVTHNLDEARYNLIRATQDDDQHFQAKRLLVDVEEEQKHYSSSICYINELLEFQPYDRDLWRRKIALYRKLGNHAEADAALQRLARIYPNDTIVNKELRDRNRETWNEVLGRSSLPQSANSLERWLELDPKNFEYYEQLINIYERMGEYDHALGAVNRGLVHFPGNGILVNKGVGLLVYQERYTQAINFAKQNGGARLYDDLLHEIAADARLHDPYEAHARLYAQTHDKDALTYLINTSLTRHYDDDARLYLNEAIKRDGRTTPLLMKLYALEKHTGNNSAALRLLEELCDKDTNDDELTEEYANLMLALGRHDMETAQWADAHTHLTRALDKMTPTQEAWPAAVSCQISVLGHLGRYEEARELLQEASHQTSHEQVSRFISAYEAIMVVRLRTLVEEEHYEEALRQARNLLSEVPNSEAALRCCINMCQTLHRDDLFYDYARQGYEAHPDIPYFIIKWAQALQQMGENSKALSLLLPHQSDEEWVNPQLVMAHSAISAEWGQELLKNHMPERALHIVDSALVYTPNNKELLFIKGLAYEHLKDFRKAWQLQQSNYEPGNAEQKEWYEHMRYIRFRSYNNRIDASYTSAFYDTKNDGLASIGHLYSVANLAYSHLFKRDAVTGQISYKGIDGYHTDEDNETGGIGLDFMAQWEHTFNHRWSGLASLAYSTRFFNKIGANLSASYAANRGWTPSLRLGYRRTPRTYLYLDAGQSQQEKFNLLLISPSVEKSWGRIKAMANIDLTAMKSGLYYNVGLKGKLFINEDNISSVSLLTGFGSFPELSFFEQTALRNVSHTNAMVGFDAQYLCTSNLYLGLAGSWNTYFNPHRLADGSLTDSYRNIYSLTLQLHVAF